MGLGWYSYVIAISFENYPIERRKFSSRQEELKAAMPECDARVNP